LAFEQGAHLEQIEQRPWVIVEQVHHRRLIPVAHQAGNVRAASLGSLDQSPAAQYLQPFTQGAAGNAQLLALLPLGWQHLAHFQHTVRDQLLDTVSNHIAHLATLRSIFNHDLTLLGKTGHTRVRMARLQIHYIFVIACISRAMANKISNMNATNWSDQLVLGWTSAAQSSSIRSQKWVPRPSITNR